jgi:hypothetical protein
MRTGLKLALLLPLFALMAPTGGFPSRPTFQQVYVGTVGQFAGLAGTIEVSRAAVPTVFMYDQSGTANAHFGRWAWTGGASSTITLGSCPDSLSGCNDFASLSPGGLNVTSPTGNANNSVFFAPTGKISQFRVESASTVAEAGMCVSDTIALCAAGDAANDTSFFGTGVLHFQNIAGTDFLTMTATAVTVPTGSKLVLSGNAQQPVVAFDASLLVGPSINTCLHCQASPTIVRNSVGNYTISPQSTGTYIWACTFRNNSGAPGFVGINSEGAGALTILTFSTAGSLADPSPNTINCVGVS